MTYTIAHGLQVSSGVGCRLGTALDFDSRINVGDIGAQGRNGFHFKAGLTINKVVNKMHSSVHSITNEKFGNRNSPIKKLTKFSSMS